MSDLLSVYERFKHLDELLRDVNDDSPIAPYHDLKTCAVLWEAISKWASEPCVWREDQDGVWFAGCDQSWTFEEGGPVENDCRYCSRCGRRLEAVKFVWPDEEEDDE